MRTCYPLNIDEDNDCNIIFNQYLKVNPAMTLKMKIFYNMGATYINWNNLKLYKSIANKN